MTGRKTKRDKDTSNDKDKTKQRQDETRQRPRKAKDTIKALKARGGMPPSLPLITAGPK